MGEFGRDSQPRITKHVAKFGASNKVAWPQLKKEMCEVNGNVLAQVALPKTPWTVGLELQFWGWKSMIRVSPCSSSGENSSWFRHSGSLFVECSSQDLSECLAQVLFTHWTPQLPTGKDNSTAEPPPCTLSPLSFLFHFFCFLCVLPFRMFAPNQTNSQPRNTRQTVCT